MMIKDLNDVTNIMLKHKADLETQLLTIIGYARDNNLDVRFMAEFKETQNLLGQLNKALKCIPMTN